MTTATPTIATAMPTTSSQCQNASMDTIRCYPGNVLASSNANAKKKKILRIYKIAKRVTQLEFFLSERVYPLNISCLIH